MTTEPDGPIPDLVSVVVPVFNGAQHLGEALASIQAQTYSPVETIVIDDGSTDASAAIARSFDGVRVISQANAGLPSARNAGIAAARGEFVAFLDHDDVWELRKLEMQVARLRAQPDLGYVIAHLEFVLEPGTERPSWLRPELLERPQPGRVPSNLLVRRSVLDAVGLFRQQMGGGDDVDWFARATDAGVRSAVLDEPLLQRRVHPGNMTSQVQTSRADMFRALRASIARKRGDTSA